MGHAGAKKNPSKVSFFSSVCASFFLSFPFSSYVTAPQPFQYKSSPFPYHFAPLRFFQSDRYLHYKQPLYFQQSLPSPTLPVIFLIWSTALPIPAKSTISPYRARHLSQRRSPWDFAPSTDRERRLSPVWGS